jgi:hypothetical protein
MAIHIPDSFGYLMVPYNHPDEAIRQERMEAADWFAAILQEEGLSVFSPITQGARVAPNLERALVSDHDFWMRQDIPILRQAGHAWLIPMPGWTDSKGVKRELEECAKSGIDVYFLQSRSNAYEINMKDLADASSIQYNHDETFGLKMRIKWVK